MAMVWVVPLSIGVLVVGALLVVTFLTRNQWILDANGCDVRVRTSLIRATMFIDDDRVSDSWRTPGRLVKLKALVDDASGHVTTYTAVLKPRLGRPSCQIFVDGDWVGGDLLEGTRFEPASWRTAGQREEHLDTRWSTARRLLMRVQDVVGWDERIRAAIDGLGRNTHERLKVVHKLRRDGASDDSPKVKKLEEELTELMQSIQMLHMTITTEQHESALQALGVAEALVEKLSPPKPPKPPPVTRTLNLKPMKLKLKTARPPPVGKHSGAPRVARLQAQARSQGERAARDPWAQKLMRDGESRGIATAMVSIDSGDGSPSSADE